MRKNLIYDNQTVKVENVDISLKLFAAVICYFIAINADVFQSIFRAHKYFKKSTFFANDVNFAILIYYVFLHCYFVICEIRLCY